MRRREQEDIRRSDEQTSRALVASWARGEPIEVDGMHNLVMVRAEALQALARLRALIVEINEAELRAQGVVGEGEKRPYFNGPWPVPPERDPSEPVVYLTAEQVEALRGAFAVDREPRVTLAEASRRAKR